MGRGPKRTGAWLDVERVRALVESGARYAAIATEYGTSERVISKIAAAYGFSRKRGKPPVWPDCPPHLRRDYSRFRKNYGYPAREARELLEMA